MATIKDIRVQFQEEELTLLNNIFSNQMAGCWLAVGNVPITNWLGWEDSLASVVFNVSKAVYFSNRVYNEEW